MTQQAQETLDKIKALREYTRTTGFRTTRSQNDLIQAIQNPDDLASVLLALKQDDPQNGR